MRRSERQVCWMNRNINAATASDIASSRLTRIEWLHRRDHANVATKTTPTII